MAAITDASGWVRRVTDPGIRYLVGDPAFERGLGYAHGDMVAGVGTADRGRVLIGQVHGNAPLPYQTLVTLEDDAPGDEPFWSSRCSCPVGEDCKHVVAVLLTVREAAEAAAPAAPVPWESAFAGIVDDGSEADEGADMGLVVTAVPDRTRLSAAAPAWRIRLTPTRRTKAGTWAKRHSWEDVDESLRPYRHVVDTGTPVRPAHKAALARLARLYRSGHLWTGYGTGTATIHLDDLGPQAWPALAEAVAAGVSLVGSTKGASVTLAEEPAEIALDVVREDGGLRVTPTWTDEGSEGPGSEEHVVLVGDPAHGMVVLEDEGLTLVPLARSLEPSVADLLTDATSVHVPDEDVDRFLALYLPRLRERVTVLSGDGSVDLPDAVPPRLHVRVTRAGGTGVALAFGFVYATGATEQVVPLAGGRGAVPRDTGAERRLLAGLGVLERVPGVGPGGGSRAGGPALPPQVTVRGLDAVRLVTAVLPALEEHPDVVVSYEGEPPAFEEVVDAPEIRVGAAGDAVDTDWLDLHVTVHVGEEEVPFEPLFEALVRGDEVMLLETGTWFSLDHPSLQELRTLIEEARGLADAQAGHARLSRYQVGLWDELVDISADVAAQHAWVESVEALRSLEALPSPAVPEGLRASLRPYQLEGYQWLVTLWQARLGGILADDMGLGKTVQVLALLARAAEAGELEQPALVVAPTSMVATWADEAARFVPGLTVRTLPSTHRRRAEDVASAVAGADLVVTSYAVLRLDAEEFAEVPWRAVFLDEAQSVKNSRSKTHAAVRGLSAPFTLAVTGTPLENSLMDLWSLFVLAAPGLYPRRDRFTEVFRKPIESGEAPEVLDRLRRRIRPLMLRRTKEQVALDLPPKQVQVLPVDLAPGHRRLYDQHLQRERKRVLGLLEDPEANRVAILASLTRLRQLSLDPSLIDPERSGRPVSAKIDLLVEHLGELAGEGHRAIVFSQFTGFLRMVQARLTEEGITTCYLDGGTSDRARVIEDFREGDATAFLISLKAGGVGLTLTEADYVFILDPWWNPATEAQAIDRAHRIGQDKPVMVYRMVSTGTIEEKVVALQERKQDLFDRVVDDGGSLSGEVTAADIRALLDPGT